MTEEMPQRVLPTAHRLCSKRSAGGASQTEHRDRAAGASGWSIGERAHAAGSCRQRANQRVWRRPPWFDEQKRVQKGAPRADVSVRRDPSQRDERPIGSKRRTPVRQDVIQCPQRRADRIRLRDPTLTIRSVSHPGFGPCRDPAIGVRYWTRGRDSVAPCSGWRAI